MRRTFFYLVYIILYMLVAPLAAHAQTSDDGLTPEKRIAQIKTDSEHYLYAEATMSDWLQAYDYAKTLLKEQIKLWVEGQSESEGDISYVAKTDEKFFEIKARRGNYYRAFVYVKKSDILMFEEARQIVANVIPAKETQRTDTLVVTVPREAAKKPEVTLRVETKDVGATPDPLPSEIKPEAESKAKNAESGVENAEDDTSKEEDTLALDMQQVKKFTDIEEFISTMKSYGAIKEYGKFATRPSSGRYYLFIYDREGGIPARLLNEDGRVTNLDTHSPDEIKNYKNCGAIWFR